MNIKILKNLEKYPEIRDHVAEVNGWIFRNEYTWWVFLDGSDWVAYAGLSFYNKNTFYLGPTFVKESYRGLGYQSWLIQLREKYALEQGIKRMVTFVEKTNVFSLNNLKKNGYQIIQLNDNYYPETYFRLEKRLDLV